MRRYSLIAIFLHWTIAVLLAFQISVGWALEELGARGFAVFQIHKTVGVSILVLTLIRLAVRAWKPGPAPAEGGWQGALAKVVHAGLYVFMLGGPLTGWALVSTAKVKVPTLLFGIVPLPHLPLPAAMNGPAVLAHAVLALMGMTLFVLHVAGALRHHLLLRDGLIWRMMPVRSPILLVLLPLLVVGGVLVGKAILPAPAAKTEEQQHMARPQAETPEELPASTAATNVAAPAEADNAVAQEQSPALPPPAWKVQPGGSLRFSLGNDGQTINGSFGKWTAEIVMDPEHPESADIRVDIDLASASVGDAYQDGMLAGDEFFAVATHSTARFTAKGAESTGQGRYRAAGTLSLKGVSRPQTIRFSLSGAGKARKVTGSASIDRGAFGVGNGASSNSLTPQVKVNFAFDAQSK